MRSRRRRRLARSLRCRAWKGAKERPEIGHVAARRVHRAIMLGTLMPGAATPAAKGDRRSKPRDRITGPEIAADRRDAT